MESLDNNGTNITEVDTDHAKIGLNVAKFIEDDKHLETAELEKNCSIPIKEEICEMLVKTKEECDTEENVPGLFIKTELDDTKEILRFDESGNLLNVDCKITNKDAVVIESNNELFGQEQHHACEYCNKTFSKKKNLNEHVKIHSSEVFPCNICGKEFNVKSNLRKHEKSHLESKDFQCVDCGKLYRSERNLKEHVTIVHLKSNYIFPCHLCDKEFNKKSILNGHLKCHLGIKDFQCVDCGKMFRKKPSLQQHVAIAHLGQRAFQCQECGKSFTRITSLKVHKLIHTNENPHKCEFCNQGYKEKRNLMKHIEKQHPNEVTSNTEQVNNCASENSNSEPSAEDDDKMNLMHTDQQHSNETTHGTEQLNVY